MTAHFPHVYPMI